MLLLAICTALMMPAFINTVASLHRDAELNRKPTWSIRTL